MPVKIKDIDGVLIKFGKIDGHGKGGEIFSDGCEWAREEYGKVQIGLNREKLAIYFRNRRGGHKGFPPSEWDYTEADLIIAAEKELIERVR